MTLAPRVAAPGLGYTLPLSRGGYGAPSRTVSLRVKQRPGPLQPGGLPALLGCVPLGVLLVVKLIRTDSLAERRVEATKTFSLSSCVPKGDVASSFGFPK